MTTDATPTPSPPQDHQDFGAKLNELEAITDWFESDKVELNAALAKFERGMQLAGELQRELDQVENRVETIKATFSQTAVTTPATPGSASDHDEPSNPDNPATASSATDPTPFP